MNQPEKVILVVGVALLLVCVCFPPYRAVQPFSEPVELGRQFVLSPRPQVPPPPPAPPSHGGSYSLQELTMHGPVAVSAPRGPPIVIVDWAGFGLQMAASVLLTAFAFGVARVMRART